MLIYTIFMAALSVFLYRESKKLLRGESKLLQEFCKNPISQKTVLSMLRIILLSSAASAALMLLCLILTRISGEMPKPLAMLSILCYSVGFISAMFKLKNMQ